MWAAAIVVRNDEELSSTGNSGTQWNREHTETEKL